MLSSSSFKLLSLGLLSLQKVLAADPVQAVRVDEELGSEGSPAGGNTPNIAVKVSTSFPQAEIFGVKLVNGYPTTALLSFTNSEPMPITVRFIGASLWTTGVPGQESRIIRNLTTTSYESIIPAGESESYNYKFTTDMHPQDVRLSIAAILSNEEQVFFTMSAFNETVGIVEAPTSIFDPQTIFLYLVLTGFFGGIAYFLYSYWIVTLFPKQKKRAGGKGGDRAKTSSRGSKNVDGDDQISVAGADGPAVTSGAKTYDESWIPQSHLKRPEAKRIRSGTPSGVRTKKA